MIERRKHTRTNIQCRVFFECSDAHDQVVSQNMGMALDISEKGMLLETSTPIQASTIKVMLPVKEKEVMEVMGDIIYSIPMPDNRYRTGIVFHKPGDDTARLVKAISHER
jgi:hypothetical protein